MKQTKKAGLLIFILGLLSAIGPFTIDMYLPGFPEIAKDLGTSVEKVSLTLTGYFIGIAFGQLVYGPLLDRYGRKLPLYAGLIIYLVASLGCSTAHSLPQLVTWRFIQALGSCAGMVASRAIVRDYFAPGQMARVFSALMLVIGVSPLIAPATGGYVVAHFSWRIIFYILAGMALLLLVLVFFFLPESKAPDKTYKIAPKPVAYRYLQVIKNPVFMIYTFTGAIASAGLYAYISGSPFLFLTHFGESEKVYGWIFAIIASGLILATQLNSFLLRRFYSRQVIPVALGVQFAVGLTALLCIAAGWLTTQTAVVLLFLFLSCQGFTFPNASALAMTPFVKNAGSASAFMGFVQMALGALTSLLMSELNNGTEYPMFLIMTATALFAFGIVLNGNRRLRKKNMAVHI